MKDILDVHTHSLASGHAYSTPHEMIQSAVKKGLALFGMSDHAPKMPGASSEMYFHNFRVIDRNPCDIELVMGAELNIIDYNGNVDLPEKVLGRLDFTIASMHDICVDPGTIEQNTASMIAAMQNPYITIIGHPDDSYFPLEYEPLVLAAKEHHVLLELNSSSLRAASHRRNTRENITTMLGYCRLYEVPIIISSDAHIEADIGNHKLAHELIAELDFPENLVVNTAVEKFRQFLRQ